jgi:hypothetical protein
MNSIDDLLNRLFKAASRAPKAGPEAASFALETRVMADWRASLRGDTGDFLVLWLRRATIGACVLAVASLAWNYQQLTNSGGDELSMAESTMRMGVDP